MADPFSDQDHGPGGASKRPAQTIEGTATEISEEAAGGDAAREAEAGPPRIAPILPARLRMASMRRCLPRKRACPS